MARRAVAKKEETPAAVYTEERPDWMGEGRRGSEGVSTEDLTIPRVDVLQSLSPQVSKRDDAYIEGAEPGLIFNTVSGLLYGEEVMVVPVYFRKEYVIWKDRAKGGGFRGAYPTMAEAEAAMAALEDAADCAVLDTAQHFVLIVHEAGTDEAVMSLSRTKMKMSRKWNTQIHMAGGDRFSHIYKVRSVETENEKGKFFTMDVTPMGWVGKELFQRAEALYEAVSSGEKDVDRRDDGSSSRATPEDGEEF